MNLGTSPCASDEPQDLSRSTRRPNSHSELRRHLCDCVKSFTSQISDGSRHLCTPDDELRDSLTGGSLPNSISDSPHSAPAERQLGTRRRRRAPSQNPLAGRRPFPQTLANSQHCSSPRPLNSPTSLRPHILYPNTPPTTPLPPQAPVPTPSSRPVKSNSCLYLLQSQPSVPI